MEPRNGYDMVLYRTDARFDLTNEKPELTTL